MNHVSLIGRLTKDVELRYTANNNTAVASFTLAVNRQFKKESEDRQADFITCKAFGKSAEFIEKYFKKGSQMGIEGRIQTGSYDKEGTRVYTTEVIVEKTHFTGSKGSDNGGSSSSNSNSAPGFFPVDDGDDELPF
jgi:single-strand DNA-binding protein